MASNDLLYLGFVNSVKAKLNLDERKLIERIQECEKENHNFKIILLTIKDNIFFDLDLSDKANYSVFFLNEIKREIKELKDKVDTLTTEMGNMKSEINNLRLDVYSLKADNKILRKEMN